MAGVAAIETLLIDLQSGLIARDTSIKKLPQQFALTWWGSRDVTTRPVQRAYGVDRVLERLVPLGRAGPEDRVPPLTSLLELGSTASKRVTGAISCPTIFGMPAFKAQIVKASSRLLTVDVFLDAASNISAMTTSQTFDRRTFTSFRKTVEEHSMLLFGTIPILHLVNCGLDVVIERDCDLLPIVNRNEESIDPGIEWAEFSFPGLELPIVIGNPR